MLVGDDGNGRRRVDKPAADRDQSMLDELRKTKERIAELETAVAHLASTVKEQAAQIQKVSAQLELSKPAPQTVENND